MHHGRALREPRGVRGRAADARGQRQEHEREPRAHLARLGRDDGAASAVVEVRLEPRRVAPAQLAARVPAEAVDRPPALGLVGVAQVRLDPRLPQPFAGTVGQGGRRVRAHADQRGDLLRLHALDLGVPEHLLPAGRQGAERLRGRGPVEGVERGGLASWPDPRTTRGSRGSSPGARGPSSPRCCGRS